MFSTEFNGYSRKDVNNHIANLKSEYEAMLMEERLKVLDAEKKVMELRNKEKEFEDREANIKVMLDSFRKIQAQGSSNIDILRIEQLRIIYLQILDLMKELSVK